MPKQTTYTAAEAPGARDQPRHLRRWDRSGRIRTQRDASNRRIVAASEIDRLKGVDSDG
jgi:predicted site-specific integrase-resolvase